MVSPNEEMKFKDIRDFLRKAALLQNTNKKLSTRSINLSYCKLAKRNVRLQLCFEET